MLLPVIPKRLSGRKQRCRRPLYLASGLKSFLRRHLGDVNSLGHAAFRLRYLIDDGAQLLSHFPGATRVENSSDCGCVANCNFGC